MTEKRVVLGALALWTLLASADDLPWRFDGEVTRDAATSVVAAGAVLAPAARDASAATEAALDSASGRSSRESDALERFDSRMPSGFMVIIR